MYDSVSHTRSGVVRLLNRPSSDPSARLSRHGASRCDRSTPNGLRVVTKSGYAHRQRKAWLCRLWARISRDPVCLNI
ncbi:hypothetical protein M407DRAFT_99770 [Tulasnella calospora MUT 4182]|uniref:Uncharacterized protein n=1 Tax=Tulasnella calospora MUT 4182 TaxID=1051891 RepID=A0A0C3LT46_9AGAM|nr:hypothetical protein M407DRAFT_99770 [Tulasnella calospora MUT 4182]